MDSTRAGPAASAPCDRSRRVEVNSTRGSERPDARRASTISHGCGNVSPSNRVEVPGGSCSARRHSRQVARPHGDRRPPPVSRAATVTPPASWGKPVTSWPGRTSTPGSARRARAASHRAALVEAEERRQAGRRPARTKSTSPSFARRRRRSGRAPRPGRRRGSRPPGRRPARSAAPRRRGDRRRLPGRLLVAFQHHRPMPACPRRWPRSCRWGRAGDRDLGLDGAHAPRAAGRTGRGTGARQAAQPLMLTGRTGQLRGV